MQNKDYTAEHANNATSQPDTDAAQAQAFGLNADDSLSESAYAANDAGMPDSQSEGTDTLQKELDEMRDKYLRLAAEFDNWKRRTAKEGMEMRMTAGREIIQELLPVLDDAERAEKTLASATDMNAVKEGVQLIINKLRNTLQQRGLRRMDSNGQAFDAEMHEAITEVPAADPLQSGNVVDTIEPGYYLNDKLIRYAKVVVGK